MVAGSEEWSGVFPLVRRIFGEISPRLCISTTNELTFCLVFYLDFKYGKTVGDMVKLLGISDGVM